VRGEDVLVELRAWRDEFARSHGYDLRVMEAALREIDGAAGQRVVSSKPRPPVVRPAAEPSPPNHSHVQPT
jgi:hypothetical protein